MMNGSASTGRVSSSGAQDFMCKMPKILALVGHGWSEIFPSYGCGSQNRMQRLNNDGARQLIVPWPMFTAALWGATDGAWWKSDCRGNVVGRQ